MINREIHRRQHVVELLLGILIESTPFELPADIRKDLLETDSGSWVIPQDLRTNDGMVTWKNPSLYWMWQEESKSCCINFLAHSGQFEYGSMQSFQWTLEASYPNESSLPVGEMGRLDPSALTTLAVSPIISSVRSFWKMASLQLMCVEFSIATLLGTLSQEMSTRWKLDSGAVFSCDAILLASPLPKSSAEHVQVAEAISLLDFWKTPELDWRSPPGVHGKFDSLSDIFRYAYALLEDEQVAPVNAKGVAAPKQANATKATNDQSRRKIDIKESMTNSLAITGGLMATGASFVTPVGAAVSVAAVGVKDSVVAAAKKGQASRDGDGYRFGDVARGVASSFQEKKNRRDGFEEELSEAEIAARDHQRSVNQSRYAGVAGSSLGAAAGLVIAGPIGFFAGSLLGGAATQEAMQNRRKGQELQQPPPSSFISSSRTTSADSEIERQLNLHEQEQQEQEQWKFGDNIRGAIKRGKVASGRDENSGYQFGDLSRGLFGKKK